MKISRYFLEKRVEALEGSQRASAIRQSEIDSIDIKSHIAEVYWPVHEDICQGRHEFYNLRGGRGSGKSSFCALETVDQIMKDKTGLSNALVVRKWAVTLRGSVYSQLQWALAALRVEKYWKSTLNPLQFIYEPTGQVIRLTGLDDPQKLKSIKPVRGFFRILWCEEFCEISGEPELRNLQQSVLRGGSGFIVLRSFNPPISKANWANVFCDRPDPRSMNVLTNYLQVPVEWLGQAFYDEAERLKEVNERAFQNEYLGLSVGSGAEVFQNLEVREITDEEYESFDRVYSGLDWGFASDPACFLRCSYNPKSETIWIMDEIYKTHLSNAELAQMIIDKGFNESREGVIDYGHGYTERHRERAYIICDSAEPKSIEDFRRMGLKAGKCTKFQGCVSYRIKWLQHRKIVVDPARTPNTARELQNYTYDVDKRTGEVLSTCPDRNNHSLDSLAYALDKVIYAGRHSA